MESRMETMEEAMESVQVEIHRELEEIKKGLQNKPDLERNVDEVLEKIEQLLQNHEELRHLCPTKTQKSKAMREDSPPSQSTVAKEERTTEVAAVLGHVVPIGRPSSSYPELGHS